MPDTVTVNLAKPVKSVKILDNYNTDGGLPGRNGISSAAETQQVKLMQDFEAQKAAFSQASQAVKGLIAKLNQFYDKIFAEHKEEIAKLSVEIARKILVQKVQKVDYEIESIVKEALNNSPTRQDVVVHLNPEDLVQFQKVQQDDATDTLAGIKFVSDPDIGRAECLLESPKGIIKSMIDEHLERIGKALKKEE